MVDYDFIGKLEGNKDRAYIPKNDKGNIVGHSGVTIGKGLDLGNFGDLYNLDIPNALREKLEPYVGLRRELAEQALKDNPLELSDKELSELNKAVIKYYTGYVRSVYEEDSGRRWDNLPDRAKTVILSVLFQYGSPKRVPKFWSYATSHNWSNMIEELRDFGDNFPTRRNLEADYLENNYV